MAQARSQAKAGMTAVHVWLVGFVFLWLVSMVLLVWLYTDQESIKKDNDDLRSKYAKVISGAEERLPWFGQGRAGGPTMVGLLEGARKETALLAIGEEAEDAETVRTKVEGLLTHIIEEGLMEDSSPYETPALLPAMSALYESFSTEHALRVAAEDNLAVVEERWRNLVDSSEQQRADFDSSTDQIKEEVAALEQDHASYSAGRDREVDEFEQQLDDRQQQYARDIQEQRNLVRREQQRLEELQTRFAELKSKLGELQIGPAPLLPARQADGEIVKADPGDDVVYINLGRQHRLTLGLQFAVYSAATGIGSDGRSKGRIEVVRIFETTAECNIKYVHELDVVVVGDLIANPVYDRQRALRFVVIGEFDTDGDGRADLYGADQIKSLISDWGGEVVDAVSSRVDFVVAGYAPLPPREARTAKATREDQERRREIMRRVDEFNAMVTSATQLSVPMLTQEVFLRFLGY